MEPRFRDLFNHSYSDQLYQTYTEDLQGITGRSPFRLAESPVFLPGSLKDQLAESAQAILSQLMEPERLEEMKRAVPPRWNTPGMDALPSFTQIDFAIIRDTNGELAPRLIELQGFPSLTAFQVVQRDAWNRTLQTIPGLNREWTCWFNRSREESLDIVRRTIVGNHDPENVILMDLDPPEQKTVVDFVATKVLFDVDAVDPTTLIKEGRQLWRMKNGKRVPVERIYNRIVFDELLVKGIELPFDYREELDVEWSPHPNWYWVWSKHSLPYLDHWSVPKATFVADLKEIPSDLTERYVLKPLFSFAGGGVNVDPTQEDIDRIPEKDRHAWCIQEKIAYAPALRAVDGGGVKVEVRIMFLRPDDEERPILVQNLCRLSRGKMLGVDFNKDFTWVGSSIGIWPE